jgi:hypothetical protein
MQLMSLCYTTFQVIAKMVKTAVFTTIMNVAATTVTTMTTTDAIINFRLLCVAVGQQFLHDWSSQDLLQVGWEWAA